VPVYRLAEIGKKLKKGVMGYSFKINPFLNTFLINFNILFRQQVLFTGSFSPWNRRNA
jgi:hypothetical protein